MRMLGFKRVNVCWNMIVGGDKKHNMVDIMHDIKRGVEVPRRQGGPVWLPGSQRNFLPRQSQRCPALRKWGSGQVFFFRNVTNFYNSSCFPTWQAIFHVSNNASSHGVRVNVTCNIGRRNDWMPIACFTECCAQCPSGRECRRRALLQLLEVSMQDVLNDTQTHICMEMVIVSCNI